MTHAAARRAVAEACRRLSADGLVVGTAGNVSVLDGGLVVISPSGVPYAGLTQDDVCVADLDGRPVAGRLVPSSEWRLHAGLYQARDEITAVVHAHPTAATAVSALVDEVPPVHYLLAALGGAVRVAAYETYGTVELAERAVAALDGRSAALHANHGATTVGASLEQAHERMLVLEWICRVWLTAQAAGTPALLDTAELDRVAARLRGYGQPT